jgi:hypothetical protein
MAVLLEVLEVLLLVLRPVGAAVVLQALLTM